MAQLFLLGGPLIAGAIAGAYKVYSSWIASERGKSELQDKFGVLTVNVDSFRAQLTKINEIGCGSAGIVYKCMIPELGNHGYFAVKHLGRANRVDLSQEECITSSDFYRELEILAPCRHPAIVRIVAVSLDNAELILIYPFIAGGDLEQRLSDCGSPLSGDQRAHIALDLLDAVIYLHTTIPDKPCILHRYKLIAVLVQRDLEY
jgi:serine/threonine protein kinase